MMKVYVVQINHGVDNIENMGIFSNLKKANEFAESYRNNGCAVDVIITEVELDKATAF